MKIETVPQRTAAAIGGFLLLVAFVLVPGSEATFRPSNPRKAVWLPVWEKSRSKWYRKETGQWVLHIGLAAAATAAGLFATGAFSSSKGNATTDDVDAT